MISMEPVPAVPVGEALDCFWWFIGSMALLGVMYMLRDYWMPKEWKGGV